MRPYVIVNVASSIDGKISNEERIQLRISCDQDFKRVDELRASVDAVMVGIGTVLSDNPKLNVKSEELRRKRIMNGLKPDPVKVIVDSKCRIPEDAEVLKGEAIIAVAKIANKERVERIAKRAEVLVLGEERVDLKALMSHLYDRGIRKILVEGGGTLISSLLSQCLVDEFFIYFAPIFIGGANSPTICDGRSFEKPIEMELVSISRLGRGILVHLKPKKHQSQ